MREKHYPYSRYHTTYNPNVYHPMLREGDREICVFCGDELTVFSARQAVVEIDGQVWLGLLCHKCDPRRDDD